MCDDITERENTTLADISARFDRREFSLMGVSAASLALLPAHAVGHTLSSNTLKTKEQLVTISTTDGEADAFFVHPVRGRHPAILMWPDVAGLRPAYEIMATRLAQAGYAVLVINPYYRSGRAPVFQTFAEWRTEAGQAKLAPMRSALTSEAIQRDGGAFIDWLDAQAAVDTNRKIGSCGYCMGGPFTFYTALARRERVGVIASFHGARLVTADADSPDALIPRIQAALFMAIAQNDDDREPEAKERLRSAAHAAQRSAEIDVYPAQHGWCTLDSPVFDKAQADKAGDRMLVMLKTHL